MSQRDGFARLLPRSGFQSTGPFSTHFLTSDGWITLLDISGISSSGIVMNKTDRVVTANLPSNLVGQMDEVCQRIDRSKSWIVREALTQWLDEEHRRNTLSLEA